MPIVMMISLVICLISAKADASVAGNISTVAGPGVEFNQPYSITIDSSNNIYIADSANNVIRKIDNSTGILSTIAGNGLAGYSGDGNLATLAELSFPNDLCIDSSGNIYIADMNNHAIRKIDHMTGYISTIAGVGSSGYTGDGELATSAKLNFPSGVAVKSSGDVYIADQFNHVIRKINAASGVISTYAGNRTAGYSGDGDQATSAMLNTPSRIAYNSTGDVFVADYTSHVVRKIDATTGVISTYAGNGTMGNTGNGGLATSAELNSPYSVSVDSSGDIYIGDVIDLRIRKVDHSTRIISTFAGNGLIGYSQMGGLATSGRIGEPYGLAFDSSRNAYESDPYYSILRKIDATTGILSTYAGNLKSGYYGDGELATLKIMEIMGAAVDSIGNLFFADIVNNIVFKVDQSTGNLSVFAGTGEWSVFPTEGDGGPANLAKLRGPSDVAVDTMDNVYVADHWSQAIKKIDTITGVISTYSNYGSDSQGYPDGLAVNESGDVFVAARTASVIWLIDHTTGNISIYAGNKSGGYSGDGGVATLATLNYPQDVAIDSSNDVYITDENSNRIRKVDHMTGIISTIAGTGTAGYDGDNYDATLAKLSYPNAVTVDSNKNVYIADTNNHVIRKIDAQSGIISTIAGNGIAGYSGDGGSATAASLNYPNGVAIDFNGNLFISDTDNSRIREVYQAGPDVASPSVSVAYGNSYSDCSGSHSELNGHSYIRIKLQDNGSGLSANSMNVSELSNATFADIEESSYSVYSTGISSGTNNPVYFYFVKNDSGKTSEFTFKATDVFGNIGHPPNLNITQLSFAEKRTYQECNYRQLPKEQGKVSILAKNGDLKNVLITANNVDIPVGDISSGSEIIVDLRSKLKGDNTNSIKVSAEGETGTDALILASSAILDSIEPYNEKNRKVYARGDLNQDGHISVSDSIRLLHIISEFNHFTAEEMMIGDVNLDGKLTINDVVMILKKAINL